MKPIYELSDVEYKGIIYNFQNVLDSYQALNKAQDEKNYISLYLEEQKLVSDLYKNSWSFISPELYYIFWSLKLKDIYFPGK